MNKELLKSELEKALSSKDYENLEALALKAIDEFPDESFLYEFMSESNFKKTPPNFPKAEQCIAKAINLDPQNADYLRKFGDIKAKQLMAEDANILYRKALKINPKDVNSLVGVGLYQSRIARLFNDAIETLENAYQLNPNYPDINYFLAEAYFGAEKINTAEMKIRAAISEVNFELDKILFLINILDASQKYNEVCKEFEKLISKQPNDARFYLDYARYLFMDNQYKEVIENIDKGISLSSDEVLLNTLTFEPYFESLLRLGNSEKLLSKINSVLTFSSNEKVFILYSAKAKELNGDLQGALSDYKKLKELSTTKIEITKYNFEIAKLLINNNKIEEANKLISEIESIDKVLGELGRALILFNENKQDLSYRMFKKLFKNGSVEAEEYLSNNFSEYLKSKQKEILSNFSSEFEKNNNNEVLKPLFGKFFKFSDFESGGKSIKSELKELLNDSLKNYSAIFTEFGAILFNPSSIVHQVFTYQVTNSNDKRISLKCIPLDGDDFFNLELIKENDFLKIESNEKFTVVMKEIRPENISVEIKQAFLSNFERSELDFLGSNASNLIEALY